MISKERRQQVRLKFHAADMAVVSLKANVDIALKELSAKIADPDFAKNVPNARMRGAMEDQMLYSIELSKSLDKRLALIEAEIAKYKPADLEELLEDIDGWKGDVYV